MSFTRAWWIGIAIVPVFTFLSRTMCVWPAPRFAGPVSLVLLSLSVISICIFIIAVVLAIYFGVNILIKADCDRKNRIIKASKSVVLAVLLLIAMWFSQRIRQQALYKIPAIASPVVSAVEMYRIENGVYPGDIDSLVPEYLEEIPFTGMIAYPRFKYTRIDLKGLYSYKLYVLCPSGPGNFDSIIYQPSEKYPEQIDGNPVERIGEWAYIHE